MTDSHARAHHIKKYPAHYICAVALSNVIAMALFWPDGSRSTLAATITHILATNGALALLSLFAYAALVRHGRLSFVRHTLLSLGIPLLAVVCDWFLFFVMNIRAC